MKGWIDLLGCQDLETSHDLLDALFPRFRCMFEGRQLSRFNSKKAGSGFSKGGTPCDALEKEI